MDDLELDPIPAQQEESPIEGPQVEDGLSWGDRTLVPGRPLSPRHRKLCELAAQGISNQKIAEALDYSDGRVSILLSNTQIREEIDRIRERIYEDTIGGRLKRMAEPALSELERCLSDRTNRYKENLKVDTAKWILEKLDGKAVQKHDIGENILGLVMDKLDGLKNAGKVLDSTIDVTPLERPQLSAPSDRPIDANAPKTEEELLRDWVMGFENEQK